MSSELIEYGEGENPRNDCRIANRYSLTNLQFLTFPVSTLHLTPIYQRDKIDIIRLNNKWHRICLLGNSMETVITRDRGITIGGKLGELALGGRVLDIGVVKIQPFIISLEMEIAVKELHEQYAREEDK